VAGPDTVPVLVRFRLVVAQHNSLLFGVRGILIVVGTFLEAGWDNWTVRESGPRGNAWVRWMSFLGCDEEVRQERKVKSWFGRGWMCPNRA
jgi:hypothetical protein